MNLKELFRSKTAPEDTEVAEATVSAPVSDSNWTELVPTDNSDIVKKGTVFVFGFLGLFFLWSVLFPISSAVVAEGKIVSSGQNKLVQHSAGGVVKDILVADGDVVEKGQVLLVLDASAGQAELTRLQARHSTLLALKSRYQSERVLTTQPKSESNSGLQLRGTQVDAGVSPDAEESLVMIEQRRELDAGRKRLNAELDAALFQVESLKDQKSGSETRLAGARQLLLYTKMEIKKIKPLVRDGYLAKNRLWELDKRRLEQISAVGNLEAEVDSLDQRIKEGQANLSRLTQVDRENRSKELTNVISELAEISDQLTAAKMTVELTELRAPQSGTIVKLEAHTKGGVIERGAVIAEIVPSDAGLETEFRVALADIGSVKMGQKARVMVTALNSRTYDPIDGKVSYVSADSEVDQATGQPFFTARAKFTPDDAKNSGISKVQAGMATQVFALAEPRVFMSYVLQPIMDSFGKAFIETK